MKSSRVDSTLPAGGRLAAWLQAGGRPDRAGRSLLWAYRWRGLWFDRNWRLQQRLYPVDRQLQAPVFVLGLWRSGTTYLHELLTTALEANCPRTWQCFDPSAFRLHRAPSADKAERRPMDAVMIDAQSPQEDEFALLAAGIDSAYRFFLDPRRWTELQQTLSVEYWTTPARSGNWAAHLETFLNWCVEDADRPLVAKSPNHIFRADGLRQAWPQARLVWVLRDPVQLWHSNLRMWRAMAQRYSLWQWTEADLLGFVGACLQAYHDTLVHLRGRNYDLINAAVKYDDLATAPAVQLQRVLARIGAPLGAQRLAAAVAKHPPAPSIASAGVAPAEKEELFESIRQEQERMLAATGGRQHRPTDVSRLHTPSFFE